MENANNLIDTSRSILKLYRHIIKLSKNNQDTNIMWDVVKRLTIREDDLLQKVFNDSKSLEALDNFLCEQIENQYQLCEVLSIDNSDYDDLLIASRINIRKNAVILRMDDEKLGDLYNNNIPIIIQNGIPNVPLSCFYTTLLLNTYNKNIARLEEKYINEYIELNNFSNNIQKIKDYQLIHKYIYSLFDDFIPEYGVSSLLKVSDGNIVQQEMFSNTVLNIIFNDITYLLNNILTSSDIVDYNIDDDILRFLNIIHLRANLAILEDNNYNQIRDSIEVQLNDFLLTLEGKRKKQYVDLIRNEFSRRDEETLMHIK